MNCSPGSFQRATEAAPRPDNPKVHLVAHPVGLRVQDPRKETGRRRGALLLNGQRYDHVSMDCLASEFESPQPGWFTL
ncbi:MAG TPA: hypothetical protein VF026_25365 [Ktedonobacteraceae bacterium]